MPEPVDAPSSLVVWSPELLGYDFGPGHPMAPTRLLLTMRLVRGLGLLDAPGVREVDPAPADDAALATVHDPRFVAAVREASERGVTDPLRGLGTDDDPVFPGMHEAAARIFEGSLLAASAVWKGHAEHAVNIAGGMHHAKRDAASGFCIYNDAAGAVQRLLDEGAERVAYVDLDAHHGDGVESVFWDDPRVLTFSVHQSGRTLFPGTGYPTDVGGPRAEGTAVNVALPPRSDGRAFLRAVDAVLPPVLRAFEPQAVVSQHGCDAHALDPLTDLRVGVDAQRDALQRVHALAHEVADGRWVALGGGGYAVINVVPRAWANVVAEVVHAPLDPATPLPQDWRDAVSAGAGEDAPARMGDHPVEFRPWSSGFDPADELDRAIVATRRAVFPYLGLDPLLD
ncbi:acetoin utilization protein AcuC [Luteimicrobium subarcticum]|uniref:Acetoin utilization protein AcuC n=1 Tax=Luteimicrobium subarcticum TaxID=620910 RepID=A0A2M8WVS5_9MICO|nr:acetoin utilization protein AcuC [Luteimicrobium subarcticum]PJI95027.1 acetoin utilization protein AcuC [Luteimicrobium subarcticum]